MPEGTKTQEELDQEAANKVDTTSAEFLAAVNSAVTEQTSGLRDNRDAVLGEKRELKTAHDALKKQLDDLGDLDTVKAMVDRFKNDEEAKLIADGKIDEVLNKRTESLRRDSESRVTAATAKVAELEEGLAGAYTRIATLIVGSSIDAATAKLECAPTARVDIRRAALEVFSLNSENEGIEARDKGGVLLMGPDGKTPLSPGAWLEGQKEACPHWWGPSAGGGAGGGVGVKGKDSVDAEKLDKMSGREMISHAMQRGGS